MKSQKLFLILIALFAGCALNVFAQQETDRDRTRDAWQRPQEVFDALALKPGHRVADVGCGSGYFTFRLAAQVGVGGKVFAVKSSKRPLTRFVSERTASAWSKSNLSWERAVIRICRMISTQC
jgi:predicted methyltransferase